MCYITLDSLLSDLSVGHCILLSSCLGNYLEFLLLLGEKSLFHTALLITFFNAHGFLNFEHVHQNYFEHL